MSGGVDSSVAAILLKNAGYSVFGITMLNVPKNERAAIENKVQHRNAAADAAAVCRYLGVKHHVVDLRAEFEKQIIHDFVEEYLAGRTPNPCVHCNAVIKWGVLRDRAAALGAEAFATGHYARILQEKETGRYCLLKAQHKEKDQSYVLWRLSQKHLAATVFPLGEFSKKQVRQIAGEHNLELSGSESQEICFIHDDDYGRFLRQELSERGAAILPGDIIDNEDRIIGRHQGFPFYTIGQRKGLGVALGRPMYVTEIDPAFNRIRIGDKSDLFSSGLIASRVNWISEMQPSPGIKVQARIRYKDPGYAAELQSVGQDSVTVRFSEPRPAVTPGQSAVFYQDDVVIGGGIISQAIP